ncbi:MAG: YbjN domain-containing protein [Gemmatales bacterium]
MGQIFNAVVDFLTDDGWKYTILEEDQDLLALTLSFKGRSGSWQCFSIVDEEKHWLRFYSILPVHIPEDKRADIIEFMTRANYGLMLGNYEMDMNDGEVRFKTSIDAEGGELTKPMIDNLLRSNLISMDRYFPGLMAVLYSDRSPADIYEDIASEADRPTLEEDD